MANKLEAKGAMETLWRCDGAGFSRRAFADGRTRSGDVRDGVESVLTGLAVSRRARDFRSLLLPRTH